MTAESSNASTERILHLLVLLMAGEYSREDVFTKIDAYHRDADPDSERRMFERDVSTLARAGITITRHAGKYSITLEQFERTACILTSEQMYPTALDAGLLVWIPSA
jgi:predicted DNA-binding transcriptional regulator YafY